MSGWVGADVQSAFLESLLCLAVAQGKDHTQVCAFLHFGKVQHGIDQARAAALGDVPGLGAQRRPGGSARSFGGDLGCGDCALIAAYLDVPMQFLESVTSSAALRARRLNSWTVRMTSWLGGLLDVVRELERLLQLGPDTVVFVARWLDLIRAGIAAAALSLAAAGLTLVLAVAGQPFTALVAGASLGIAAAMVEAAARLRCGR